MTLNKNTIFLKKAQKIVIATKDFDNLCLAATIQGQLMYYGRMLTQEAFDAVRGADAAEIVTLMEQLTDYLKEATGNSRAFKSLFGNFPKDVMSMSHAEYYHKQFLHYLGVKHFDKTLSAKDAGADSGDDHFCFSHQTYHMIDLGTEEQFLGIFTQLLSVGSPITNDDTTIIKWFVNSGLKLVYPKDIPLKANLGLIASLCPTFTVKTVTDVLRVAVALSGGDANLPPLPRKVKQKSGLSHRSYTKSSDKTQARRDEMKFNLTKDESMRVMHLLENSNLSLEEMNSAGRYGRWIRLFEVLQIQKYRVQYPCAFEAAYKLRNQKRGAKKNAKYDTVDKIITFESRVQAAFDAKDLDTALNLLASRPGILMRKIDFIVRTYPKQLDKLFAAIGRNIDKVSPKVMYEVINHFLARSGKSANRSVFIKGARNKVELPVLPKIADSVIEAVIDGCYATLATMYGNLPSLGKIYIDPELKKIPLPTNMASMSSSLVTMVRGQRMKLQDVTSDSILRCFIHWYDDNGDQDIDQHGYLINSKGGTAHFGYNGSRISTIGCYSGDVRCRRGACAEYVDINIKNAVAQGYRYYMQVAHNFNRTSFANLNECFAGYMTVEKAVSDMTFKPSKVGNCVHLQSDADFAVIGIFDLEKLEYIHLDMDFNANFASHINSGSGIAVINKLSEYVTEPKFSVHTLCMMHLGRGEYTENISEADTVFAMADFEQNYEKALQLMQGVI